MQRGNTSEPVADALHAAGSSAVKGTLRGDPVPTTRARRIDGFMKLEPVCGGGADRPQLHIVQTRITAEELSVAVQRDDVALAGELDAALDGLRGDGTLAGMGRQWLGTDRPGSGTAVV